ncbi:hypothetical protein DCS_00634 [Drechmeria coniospora]|uniref:Uncharacterized protein n=1 Tax=Drechmeria coniospora TaxID=98403 RepID=A0A151GQV2_DRECN|nr:hypothetical protein DCS_00634 [Drechmeria coniospora]KYK59504.1 hypothetical protein DCS_00634 [Drechmeria coniospora]ODA76254.1 hypothetical protein RJ55_08099 [Drechmeria coniospora]
MKISNAVVVVFAAIASADNRMQCPVIPGYDVLAGINQPIATFFTQIDNNQPSSSTVVDSFKELVSSLDQTSCHIYFGYANASDPLSLAKISELLSNANESDPLSFANVSEPLKLAGAVKAIADTFLANMEKKRAVFQAANACVDVFRYLPVVRRSFIRMIAVVLTKVPRDNVKGIIRLFRLADDKFGPALKAFSRSRCQ